MSFESMDEFEHVLGCSQIDANCNMGVVEITGGM